MKKLKSYCIKHHFKCLFFGTIFGGLLVIFIPPAFGDFYHFSWHIDTVLAEKFGSFVGGFSGTLILLISVLAFLFSIENQNNAYKKQSFELRFVEMLKLHRQNVEEMTLNGNIRGRRVFVILKAEFQDIYRFVEKGMLEQNRVGDKGQNVRVNGHDLRRDITEISFMILFLGVDIKSSESVLKHFYKEDQHKLKLISTVINNLQRYRCKGGFKSDYFWLDKNSQKSYLAPAPIELYYLREFSTSLGDYTPFNGHQSRLGHYFRNIYQIVKYVEDQEMLDEEAKKGFVKMFMAQMSNHELALFFYNSFSPQGNGWTEKVYDGKNLIEKYKLFHNLPLFGFTYEVEPKAYYPNQKYESEEIISRIKGNRVKREGNDSELDLCSI